MRTRLRSKVTLLLLAFAVAIFAVGGTAMALVSDPSGDTSGTTSSSPTITSDKADYAPGELVTLTGSGWQAGESVNIRVNDDVGQTWSRNVDVTADDSGNITDSFNLPNSFVSQYSVTATGAQSGTVTYTFTDALQTATTVSASPTSPSTDHQAVTFTGTVSCNPSNNGCVFATSNSMDFVDGANANCNGGTTLGTVSGTNFTGSGSSRTATFTTNSLSTATHSIRACFNGGGPGTAAGNSVSGPLSYVVNADTTAPSVAITSHTTGDTTTNSTINVSGTASDAAGIQSVTVNNNAATLGTGNSWSYNNLSLSCGDNTITAVATDNSNAHNTASASITVTRTCNTAPVADSQSVSTNEDTAKTITLTGSDVDGNNLTFSTVAGQGPTNGTLGTIGPVTCTATTPAPKKNCSADVTYTPNGNYNGGDSFKFRVNDGTVNSTTDATVSITVDAVNDAPSFTKGANETANEDSGVHSVPNWATAISKGPADESSQTLDFQVSNDNNALFSVQPKVSASGELTYTLAANANGTANVDVALHDSGGTTNGGVDTSATQSFTITVNAVNDAPSFTKGADQTVLEDSGTNGAHSVPWATGISAGPANESTQQLTFEVTSNSNPSLFSAAPSVAADDTLSYTLAANANGNANITVRLTDDGGTANGGVDASAGQSFTITVNAVNDAPSFDLQASPNQTVLLNAGAQSVDNFATNFNPGPSNESGQALLKYVVTITNTNNTNLFSEPPAIDNTGKLTYKLAQDAIGTATVSVKAQDDGGTANNGVDLSAAKTFTIDVNYGFSGFLQPINWTAHQVLDTNVSTFKAGSTVPVKFYLTDANGNRVVQPVNAQWITPQQGAKTNQAIDESVYTDPATSGSLYKWDSTAQQYIYNWSTKAPVAAGYFYKIGVTLPDGNTHYTYISTR